MNATLLIVEDEPLQRLTLKDICIDLGYEVLEAANGEEALFLIEDNQSVDIVLTDLSMPVMDGRDLIKAIRTRHVNIPVAVLTISRDLDDVVEVMRLGAQDFIPKPIEPERLNVTIKNLLEKRILHQEINRLRRRELSTVHVADIIGHDGSLAMVCELCRKMATSELPVLIVGENGVGKEDIAMAIHGESRRQGRPFVIANCHAIPDYLVDSVLFGYNGSDVPEKTEHMGKLKEAQGGTIFLSGIEALNPDVQSKLLRMLQEGKIEPAGSTESLTVDVRLIAATHVHLKEMVINGAFNEDLFYRLAALRVDVPPLRERQDDIEPLALNFMKRIAAQEGKTQKALSLDAVKWMQSYHWPGNVREMENLLTGAFYISDGASVTERDIRMLCEQTDRQEVEVSRDGVVQLTRQDGALKTLERVQDEVIAYALNYHNQNVTKAAEALDIGRSTLFKRLKEKDEKVA